MNEQIIFNESRNGSKKYIKMRYASFQMNRERVYIVITRVEDLLCWVSWKCISKLIVYWQFIFVILSWSWKNVLNWYSLFGLVYLLVHLLIVFVMLQTTLHLLLFILFLGTKNMTSILKYFLIRCWFVTLYFQLTVNRVLF